MATRMRAVDIKGGGGPISALFINTETPKPTPSEGQALVRIKAFGLNRMDLFQRQGLYPLPPHIPKILGVEFSGIIESFGGESPSQGVFQVGDAVFGLAYGGAYAEYIAVSTSTLIKKPKELSWEEAAGIPEVWITALQTLYVVADFKPGKSVLWHAGASAVSIAGVQLCQAEASAIYVTASSQEKIDFCKSIGATEGFSYKDGDWAQALLKYTEGKGVDLIVDFVGGSYFKQNLNITAQDGRIVNLGFLGGNIVKGEVDLAPFLMKRVRFEGSNLRLQSLTYQERLRDILIEKALDRFIDGSFKVILEKVFRMDEIRDAHELLESSQTKGKIICTVE